MKDKNGMAGASKKWKCPVYGSVIFYGREIPERWPSGVLANGKNGNSKTWRYEDNLIENVGGLYLNQPEGRVRVSIFKD